MGVLDFVLLRVCVMFACMFGVESEHLHVVALETLQQQLWRPIQLTYLYCVVKGSFPGWWHVDAHPGHQNVVLATPCYKWLLTKACACACALHTCCACSLCTTAVVCLHVMLCVALCWCAACMGVVAGVLDSVMLRVSVMHAYVFKAGSEQLHVVALETPKQQVWRPIQLTCLYCVLAEASFTGWPYV
jgi:hypothetical protein